MRFPALAAAAFLTLAACNSTPPAPAPLELPAHAAADPALVPLEFLAGRWICVNPNQTVNEEHWTAPRGKCMVGAFRQVRRDGKCAFVEVSQISVEEGALVLRLRHLHGQLEVPDNQKDISMFALRALAPRRVEFAGTGSAEGVAAVIYERPDDDTLLQTIEFDPVKTKEKPFTSKYMRER
ncbi:MAG: hypothetical protein FJ294_11110 [Planctomycetes bacterium]|nr:hypothetical protein [Planctomycetota bacterium]